MQRFMMATWLLSINIKLSPILAIPLLLLSLSGLMLFWERRKIRTVIERFVFLASRAAIPSYRSVLPELSNELARARRTQRSMSVVVLSLSPDGGPSSVQALAGENGPSGHGDGRFAIEHIPTMALVFPQIAYILRNTVRKSDIVACGPAPNEFVVALTETTKIKAPPFVERLQELMSSSGLMPLRAGMAEFPLDGLTIEDIVSVAQASSAACPSSATAEEPARHGVVDRGLVARRQAV